MNDPYVIEWLESPAGEQWSRERHCRRGKTVLVSIKSDLTLAFTWLWWVC